MKNFIRKIAKDKKITMNKVAKESELSKSQVHSVASGINVPTIETARKIAKVLGVTLEEVFPEEIK
jgi:transcriptional regulator with XRE-family HTH domain